MSQPIAMNIHPDVLTRVAKEVAYQNDKFGLEHVRSQTVPGHLLILKDKLACAEAGWLRSLTGRNSAENELAQIAAVALQALNNIQCAKDAKAKKG